MIELFSKKAIKPKTVICVPLHTDVHIKWISNVGMIFLNYIFVKFPFNNETDPVIKAEVSCIKEVNNLYIPTELCIDGLHLFKIRFIEQGRSILLIDASLTSSTLCDQQKELTDSTTFAGRKTMK